MDIISDTITDIHPIIVHFPIALLIVSAALSIWVRVRGSDSMNQASWVLLLIGTVGAIAASITGIIGHEAYEGTPVHNVIDTHQNWSFATTALFIALVVWRSISRWRGSDAGRSIIYLAVILVGTGFLTMSGMTGGDLVFDYGINVRGINPLLES